MRRLDLRARLLAGIGCVALLQLVVALVVVSATRSQLMDQIDARLQVSQSPDRELTFSADELRRPEPPVVGAAAGNYPERLGDTFEGEFADGTLRVFFAPNSTGVELSPPTIDAETARLAAIDPVTVDAIDGDVRYRVSSRLGATGHYFITGIPLTGIDDTVGRLTWVIAAAAAAVTLVLALVALWVLRLGIAPIKRMTTTAGAIAAGDWSERVADTDRQTEAGQLGAALNSMMGRIEASFEERVRAEEQLRQFIADASHELRTPVSTIRGYAELYRSGGLEEPEDLADAMRRTEQESERMSRLIGDMLNLARLDQQPTLTPTSIDLVQLVSDAAADAQATQPDRPIEVDIANAPIHVSGDADLLRQVLANLVGNALVHTDLEVPILLRVDSADGRAVIEVTDRGPGMEPEVAARVTERFFRADASRSRNRGGSGLGLAIVESAIEVHDGSLTIESAVGVGTTFRIELPLARG